MKQKGLFGNIRRGLILVAVIIQVMGCVSSPEVKMASSQMTQAINEYEQNLLRFRDLWISEIDKTLEDLGRALVVRAVKKRIETISIESKDFTSEQWRNQFREKGMITLSEEIESTQESARNYVQKLMRYELDQAAMEAGIKEVNKIIIADAVEGLMLLKGKMAEEKFQAEMEKLEAQKTMAPDPIIESYGQQIIEWRALKKEIPGNLKNLENVIKALKTTHQVVDGWIQTDVNFSGEEVGNLMVKHAETLGL